jgi:serine-type D-Ala-D-Ala carboxypeptidase (penicillin-binding protein 5/6)
MNADRYENFSIKLLAMQSITPHTVRAMTSALRRKWRPTAFVAASLLTVTAVTATAVAQPWQHTTPAQARTTASASVSAQPANPAPVKAPAADASARAVSVDATSTQTVPGAVPHIAWPHTGQSAIAIGNGHVLGISGSQSAAPTASMAKAMTAYIVLKDHPLSGGASGPIIHVTPAEAAAVGLDRRQDQQVLTVRSGEGITEKQALDALMLKSANNVARILARWDAGSITAFLTKMNANASQLGMASTHYTDPSGWDARTKSTTTDQIKLAETAMQRSDFARVVGTKSAIVPIEGRIKNVNPLLGQAGIVGIKTGSMSAAGGCLMFAAKHSVAHQTVTIVGTVMGQRNSNIGDLHQAFASSKALVEAMQRIVGTHQVIKAGQVVGTVSGSNRQLVSTKNVSVVGWSGMHYTRTIKASVPATAKAGAKVGTLTVTGGITVSVPVAVK